MEFVLASGALVLLSLCFLLYKSRAALAIKASAVALCFVFGLFAYKHYVEVLGAPIVGMPVGEFEYLHHRVGGDSMIYLWVYSPDDGDRLYVFPYDRDTAKELEQASGRAEVEGRATIGRSDRDQPLGEIQGTPNDQEMEAK